MFLYHIGTYVQDSAQVFLISTSHLTGLYGGKPRRKATELQGDTLLWAKLMAGTPITRNKQQEERLRQWEESVASEYEVCEALDGRKSKCSCGTVLIL